MLGNLSGMHMIVILAIILLLFGAPKLPALARSLGQSAKILKSEMGPGAKGSTDESTASPAAAAPAPAAAASPAAPAAPVVYPPTSTNDTYPTSHPTAP